jgi:hypothetical protein
MILANLKRKPKKAGNAEIIFDPECFIPSREGNVITLPSNKKYSYFLLKGGMQFLFVDRGYNSHSVTSQLNSFYWGGTDEGVFFVEITLEAFKAFYNLGRFNQKVFYEYVKPSIIKEIQEKDPQAMVLRQGDIWAVRTNEMTWTTLNFLNKTFKMIYFYENKSKKRIRVLNTSHIISGRYCVIDHDGEPYAFAEGILTSNDHAPLELKGLHVLAQTTGLYDTNNAD